MTHNIDYKEILDNMDESVYIADGNGITLYVNPAYTANTGIKPEMVLGRSVFDLEKEGVFSRGAVSTVLKTNQKCYILCNTYQSGSALPGFVSGVPIYDENGNIKFVVATSRPIHTFSRLRDHYEEFLLEAKRQQVLKSVNPNADAISSDFVTGNNDLMNRISEQIAKLAPTKITALITGESGVGKEIVADSIHRLSDRSDKPFVKINCAAIPASLLESELFGYEKGAFSSAQSGGKKGMFELANGGTLLLDEIGEMSIELQAKLLRAIQSREIIRVGGTKPVALDIRFIASTNANLLKLVQEGKFRQDLYYRLCAFPIHVPPLRARREDIPLFCEYFARKSEDDTGISFSFNDSEIELLKRYDWPGNVRELQNVVNYFAVCRSEDEAKNLELLNNITLNYNAGNPEAGSEAEGQTLGATKALSEKARIEDALSKCSNLREAGKLLGVNASTLSRKIKAYDIYYPKAKR